MRRSTMAIGTALVVGVFIASPASAWSLTERGDPNDTADRPDIRKVWTDLARRGLYVKVGSWERSRMRDHYTVVFDTRGDVDWDQGLEILGDRCVMWEFKNGSLGGIIGERPVRTSGPRERACRVPGGWLAIAKTVRFAVWNAAIGFEVTDRAPNRQRFVGL